MTYAKDCVKCYAAHDKSGFMTASTLVRRDVGANDVLIKIKYCGVCHSDIHTVRSEWGPAQYPSTPGHEIIGHVESVGSNVTSFKVGDVAGVGCFVDACRECENCKAGLDQHCLAGTVFTYNTALPDGSHTRGGYSSHVVVDYRYVLRIPKNLDLVGAAPLLCAGITTYSPLRQSNIKAGDKVGVAGLGGLGHMAVKIANAMGAEVTVLSRGNKKEAEAKSMGAAKFVNILDDAQVAACKGSLNLIIDTISASHEATFYLPLLKTGGTFHVVGVPSTPFTVPPFTILNRISIKGSLIGGIPETQEMLDFCGEHNIVAQTELINMDYINTAFERTIAADVRYRFVIDIEKSL